MGDLFRGERLQIMLNSQELEALDSWRFHHKMPSRAAAIRELLARGLQSTETIERKPSRAFGVTTVMALGAGSDGYESSGN